MLSLLRRYFLPSPTFVFAVGAALIVGFLSFSGIYVLWPFLPFSITGFILSVAYEGEIYYQNIKDAIDKLFNPNYDKELLAQECLREMLPVMEQKWLDILALSDWANEIFQPFDALIEKINGPFLIVPKEEYDNLYHYLVNFKNTVLDIDRSVCNRYPMRFLQDPVLKEKGLGILALIFNGLPTPAEFNQNIQQWAQRTQTIEKIKHIRVNFESVLNEEKKTLPPFFNHFLPLLRIYSQYEGIVGGYELRIYSSFWGYGPRLNQREIYLEDVGGKIAYSLIAPDGTRVEKQSTNIAAPNPFSLDNLGQLKSEILAVLQKNKHARDDDRDDKKKIKKAIQTLEQAFFNALFPNKESSSQQESLSEDSQKYLNTLSEFLQPDKTLWQQKLERRRFIFRVIQGLSLMSALFMMLGSSFLLVEAFGAFVFMAAIPFGVWPVFVVPMAIIAGTAFGLQTYNAITDFINDDIMIDRFQKIKAAWEEGLDLQSGLMVFTTLSLFALTVALSVCTGGTWWTVIKNTRPIFPFMRRMPHVVIGLATAVLGAASFMFNITNTLETLKDFFDEIWSFSLWERLKQVVNFFVQAINVMFSMSTRQWTRFLNPARIFLKLTYTPLRILLFLGHLISIAATADRFPGLNEILSALIGIISEFFEDWHYFFRFEHKHNHDIQSLYDQYHEKGDGHDHNDDLPTRLLRRLFYPAIYFAAWWDSAFSDVVVCDKAILVEPTSSTMAHPSLSFDDAFDLQMGVPLAKGVTLSVKEREYIQTVCSEKDEDSLIERLAKKNTQQASRFLFFSPHIGCNSTTCSNPYQNKDSASLTR